MDQSYSMNFANDCVSTATPFLAVSELHENVPIGWVAVATRSNVDTLTMSRKGRGQMKVMAGVTEEEVTLIVASGLMGVTYGQSNRFASS